MNFISITWDSDTSTLLALRANGEVWAWGFKPGGDASQEEWYRLTDCPGRGVTS